MKQRLLSLVQLPPPIHGAAVMNKIAVSCFDGTEDFSNRTIALKFSKSLSDLRKPSFFKFYSLIVIFFKVFKELIFNRPDLVYFTLTPKGGGFIRDCLFVMLIKLFRVKLVYHLHGKGFLDFSKKYVVIDFLYNFVFRNVKVILLADVLYDDISKYIKQENILIVPNGLDCARGTHKPLNSQKVRFCFLSNLVEGKGILDFLIAFHSLYKDSPNVEAVVVGDYRSDGTKELVKEFILSKGDDFSSALNFTGPLYNEEKFSILSMSDVFVFPTHIDTFPLVLIEAMAMGLPCVAYDEGATSSMIDNGRTGLVVEKGRRDLLAQAMLEFVKKPDLIASMGGDSLARYESEYTLEIFNKRIIEAVNSILASASKDSK